MADTKITALAAITTVDPAADVLPIVDISDTSMAASGTTKKITSNQILGAGGTATLASATITGDLTVNGLTNLSGAFGGNYGLTLNNTTSNASGFLKIAGGGTLGGGEIDFFNGATAWGGIKCVASSQLEFLSSSFSTLMTLNSTGLGVGGLPSGGALMTVGATSSVSATANAVSILSNKATLLITSDGATNAAGTTINYSWANGGQGPLIFRNNAIANVMTLNSSGNVGVGVASPTYKVQAAVASGADRNIFAAQIAGASNGFEILWNHATTTTRVIINAIPTSAAGLASGTLWNDAGTIKIA